jgi:hypothetical protein
MGEFDWVGEFERERAWVMQIPNRVIGRVLPGTVGLITLEEGHTFHAVRDNFLRLTEPEVLAYQQMGGVVRSLVAELARHAAAKGMLQPTFEVLLSAVLSAQMQALGKRQAAAPTKREPTDG